jgi:hypothetical protein
MPDQETLVEARASLKSQHLGYIVITSQQPNADIVARVAVEMTGCTLRQVSDVTLCTV